MNQARLLTAMSLLGADISECGDAYDGVIIALGIPNDHAQAIAVLGGLPPEDMHITLCYLGKLSEMDDPQRLVELAGKLAEIAQQPVQVCRFSGQLRFKKVGDNGEDAIVLGISGAGLLELREKCAQAAREIGLPPSEKYDFNAHTTVAYVPADDPSPITHIDYAPFEIPALGLWVAGHRVDFPFSGERAQFSKSDKPPDTAAARGLLAMLGGDIRKLDESDRLLREHAEVQAKHHRQIFEGLAHAIPAVRGSALEEEALHHAQEAAIARRVASVD